MLAAMERGRLSMRSTFRFFVCVVSLLVFPVVTAHAGSKPVFSRVAEIHPGWSAIGSCLFTAALIFYHRANIRNK